ncbi:MAG: MBL fold metallo-hydrolase [Saprospiraceae bacterium]|nr:MBL fold metallo-hydrolase [Saprospiraceae bacterium]MBK8885543.1 MBL fold metallo-hydrolase [Saprospiraceae bacterium]MBP6539239.1 MBL fold metallo-hydrolase [Saprospiraceae bacterium]HMT52846.1 MBL fold metallo-hydrolase [Saprospiraceae bacterium]HQV65848.1 MBL fold metallo-hydrolase [Saprospiraceae bacterium]
MKLHVLETGKFKLDGGAMFGVVPKRMWQKMHPADDDNLCTWQMRCLLVEDGNRKILIDTGVGSKQDDRFRSHFYPHDDIDFTESLAKIGLTTEDITDVFLTHFHFDHVGGALKRDAQGAIVPVFPNATYWSNEVHYNWALNPNAREAASFLKENFVPMRDQGILQMIDVQEGIKFSDNISLSFVYGHTEAMMLPYISLPSGNTLIYCADLIPSHHHIQMPYVMAYDLRPLETMKEKKVLHDVATDGKHFLFFEHDLDVACGFLTKNENGRVVFGGEVNIADII